MSGELVGLAITLRASNVEEEGRYSENSVFTRAYSKRKHLEDICHYVT